MAHKLKPSAALYRIHALLNGKEWNAQTLDDIADVVREAGFTIDDPAIEDEDEDD